MSGRLMTPARLRHTAVRVLVILLVIATVSPVLPAAPQGKPVGSVPEQPGGTAEGRSHRASTEDTGGTAKRPERGREPRKQALQVMPRQPQTEVKTGAQPTVATDSYDPRFSRELVGERDARTRVFANPDGTKTAQISAQPEFFRTPDGKWEKIDTTLIDDGGVVRNKAGAIGHRFAKNADSKALGEYRVRDGVSVGFGVVGAAPVAGNRDGDLINYADVRAQSDVELQSTTTGIKETIVLKSKDAPTEWDFPLELKGLTASLDDKGAVLFKDGTGAVKATIPHGFMEDSAYGRPRPVMTRRTTSPR